ncbi:hypothetical protein GCM10010211_62120 [Streptomyces albospinus]|uniref:Uncharacterized protein n=1 Tax=Streptomyces albospinus TaxID=285515 RepID=A0ABQ2VHJ1_9ACTN|nr:hypothetical protein GCM10010211_62120 [Streptomyces albospinus]
MHGLQGMGGDVVVVLPGGDQGLGEKEVEAGEAQRREQLRAVVEGGAGGLLGLLRSARCEREFGQAGLGVRGQPRDGGFVVQLDRTGVQLRGSSPRPDSRPPRRHAASGIRDGIRGTGVKFRVGGVVLDVPARTLPALVE